MTARPSHRRAVFEIFREIFGGLLPDSRLAAIVLAAAVWARHPLGERDAIAGPDGAVYMTTSNGGGADRLLRVGR